MTVSFASNKRAIAECDICGFRFKLKELRVSRLEAISAVGEVTVTT